MQQMNTQKSNGHLAFLDDYEYFKLDGNVYKAPVSNVLDINVHVRVGSRFYCTWLMWPYSMAYYIAEA